VSRHTVLVVEDDPQVRGLLVKLLAPEDVEVVPLESGEAALSRLDADDPVDLVLLDVGLPGLGGLEVCRQIKGHPRTRLIPVIIVTGHGAVRDRVQGIDAGADDFLVKPVERVELLARVRSLLRLKSYTDELEHAESVLFALARSIEARDPATKGHCERLSNLATSLGRYLGLDEDDILALWKAGIVHDLGKIKVPDAILLKPGPLSAEERRVIEEHPVTGDEICKPIRSFRRVRPIIRHHHERMDGSGYPDGLRGDEIPVTARVLHVVDVFDALITARPYKPAFPLDRALSTLQDEARRGWQDREIVSSFCDLVASSRGGRGKPNGGLVERHGTIQSDEGMGLTLH
jgi:putative two-component system response regulator